MTSQKVYVSIDRLDYKKNKQGVLSCQEDLLLSLKHLQDLKKIRLEKNNLKLKLAKQILRFAKKLDDIKINLPEPKIPKNLKKDNEFEKEDLPILKEQTTKNKSIEKELYEIRARIKALNG